MPYALAILCSGLLAHGLGFAIGLAKHDTFWAFFDQWLIAMQDKDYHIVVGALAATISLIPLLLIFQIRASRRGGW